MRVLRKRGAEGAYDLWVEGWRIHVPGANGKPTVERWEAPDDATEHKLVKVEEGPPVRLRVGTWIVKLYDDDRATVGPAQPKKTDQNRHYFRMMRR